MSEIKESKYNHFFPIDNFFAKYVRDKVIEYNGQMVIPNFSNKDFKNSDNSLNQQQKDKK